MERICLKIVGESGAGLLSTGEIVINALKEMGFYVVADREYPSLIKGGHSCFMINAAKEPIHSLSTRVDVMLAIDRQSLHAYFDDLRDGGILVHGYERPLGIKEQVEEAKQSDIKIVHLMSREVAEEQGGNVLMTNVVLVGMLWKTLGFDYKYVEAEVEKKFASKPKLLEIDLKCLRAGYEQVETLLELDVPDKTHKHILIDGNKSLALGAAHGGCRAYFAYPMSPASSILTHMANTCHETGILVKQVEDEISVANMTLGASYMGTRAICATSGGGFDLMTETVSLAGITETPLTVILVQRPGPATGLPTWTGQADLNLAIHSAHGEFPKVVIGCSDPADCFDLIQHAMNLSEKFQCVAIVLSEKTIAETHITIPPFEQEKIAIERGLVEGKDLDNLQSEDRYKITESGLSKRWIPGSSDAYYFANGDEHSEDGSVMEDAEPARQMYEKRMKKEQLIHEALPEPEVYGEDGGAAISLVGWGSSRNVMRDIVEEYKKKGVKVNYLHYSYLWPLRTDRLEKFFEDNNNVHILEGNYRGQLADLAEAHIGRKFNGRLLKYNGRPFFVEDLREYIDNHKA